ncbi:hypothetical protein L208DRAFT_1378107 [Tricholoma matsutake]|nr:hypothetical protein L208DRAFT_1378107 [Tricholoma matsutake 945]
MSGSLEHGMDNQQAGTNNSEDGGEGDSTESCKKIPTSSLLQLLVHGRKGSMKTKEQDAFVRLVSGYKDASESSLDSITDSVEQMLSREQCIQSNFRTNGYKRRTCRMGDTGKRIMLSIPSNLQNWTRSEKFNYLGGKPNAVTS